VQRRTTALGRSWRAARRAPPPHCQGDPPMPFVQLNVSDNHDAATIRAIADGVHEAMVATIGIPAADRFQTIAKHGPDTMLWDRSFLDVQRSDREIFVHITLATGRDDDKKRALYAKIAAEITARTDVRREDIFIVLTEVPRVNWSFGNGIAQYVPGP
jgi:phenylpyruvate tautomerase PptA (4-oxalocrotonate tautomerase family)